MESAIIGTGSHAELLPYFGLGENSNPSNLYSGVETIIADSTEAFSGFSMGYLYGSNADYGLDELEIGLGTLLTHSQDGAVRAVYYNSGLYRTIASSAFFGAMADGQNGNTKADAMMQYLSFLSGEPRPNIMVSEEELNFGITYPQVVYTLELDISNTGLDTLMISDISISGEGYIYNDLTEFILNPSEQESVEISFETDQIGQFPGELTILSNDPDTPELIIQMSSECVIPPSILYDPTFIDITLQSNNIHQEILTLTNNGGYELNCELTIGDSSQNITWLEIIQDSCSIQPNDFQEVIVIFNPNTLENGQYLTEISIIHNDPEQNTLTIPITMTLNITAADDDFVSISNKLIGNYPNPFNPVTTISFSLSSVVNAKLDIYNLKGQEIKQLVNDRLSAGSHTVTWDGTDEMNNSVSSGVYLYKLKTGNFQQTKKMILLK